MGMFLHPLFSIMILSTKLKEIPLKMQELYLVEISEDSTIAYLMHYGNNDYDFTTHIDQAWLFTDPNTIPTINTLNNLNYNIINFNDLFVPRYTIRKLADEILIMTTWGNINIRDIKSPAGIITNNYNTAIQTLEYFKYLKISDLQQQICDIAEINIREIKFEN